MIRLLRIIGAILLTSILGIIVTVLVVWVYSTFLKPGRAVEEYQAFAQAAGPWVSVIAGPLIMFLAAKWLIRKQEPEESRRLATGFLVGYALMDGAVLFRKWGRRKCVGVGSTFVLASGGSRRDGRAPAGFDAVSGINSRFR